MREVGLIGFGNFGKFLAKNICSYYRIFAYDKNVASDNSCGENITITDLQECLSKEIIVLSIPVQYIDSFLKENSKYIKKSSLIIDICSVKMKPIELMKKYLPENEIIGTHPLFGPQSGKNGISGMPIVLCPVNSNKIEDLIIFCEKKLKLEILLKSPEEHDKEMAMVQGLTHFIAFGLKDVGIFDSKMKTKSFDFLYQLHDMLKYETDDLFKTIENENPFAKDIRNSFIDKLVKINEKLD
jgi:prephenate dehydrogenase